MFSYTYDPVFDGDYIFTLTVAPFVNVRFGSVFTKPCRLEVADEGRFAGPAVILDYLRD